MGTEACGQSGKLTDSTKFLPLNRYTKFSRISLASAIIWLRMEAG
jgi:hypothetical protein